MTSPSLSSLSTEFSGADLGDRRLTRRLMQITDSAAACPGGSLPQRCGSAAELEATYRFFENTDVRPEAVLDSHIQCTLRRFQQEEQVLVIHDTTEFEFGGEHKLYQRIS